MSLWGPRSREHQVPWGSCSRWYTGKRWWCERYWGKPWLAPCTLCSLPRSSTGDLPHHHLHPHRLTQTHLPERQSLQRGQSLQTDQNLQSPPPLEDCQTPTVPRNTISQLNDLRWNQLSWFLCSKVHRPCRRAGWNWQQRRWRGPGTVGCKSCATDNSAQKVTVTNELLNRVAEYSRDCPTSALKSEGAHHEFNPLNLELIPELKALLNRLLALLCFGLHGYFLLLCRLFLLHLRFCLWLFGLLSVFRAGHKRSRSLLACWNKNHPEM